MKNKISVLIPTWKRPLKLRNCLIHLQNQTHVPFEIIVVVREIDKESIDVVEEFKKSMSVLRYEFTYEVGVVAAENAGLRTVKGDIVAFIDDDGYAPKDWIYKIDSFFDKHSEAAGYGGSDLIKTEPWSYHDYEVECVGILTWYGKIIGNHHRKALGDIREVQVLKGVNMSFRRHYFNLLDEKLAGKEGHLGNGSQWELDLCMRVLNAKGRIFFDPGLVVVHDSDHSQHNYLVAAKNNTHNMCYVILKNSSFIKQIIFILYAVLIGNTQLPGLLKLIKDLILIRKIEPLKFYQNKLIGFFQGINTYLH